VPLLGEIPLDPMLCQASDRGEPVVTAHPESPMANAFRGVAEAVMAQVDAVAGAGPVIRMGP
jgi:ATP-binding protein involved in chromosome partitioning